VSVSVSSPVISESSLIKALGSFVLTLSVMNVIVGGGIFAMPRDLAQTLGAASPLGPLLGALVIVPIAWCFAGAGSRVAATGGPYAYTEKAFGPSLGFLTGALMWISNIASSSGIANGLYDQLVHLLPAMANPAARVVFMFVLYGALSALNIFGVTLGGRAVATMAILKLSPLFLLLIVGLFFCDFSQIQMLPMPPVEALGLSMVAVMFAYSGMETALVPTGEVKSAGSNIPKATMLAIGLVVILYFGLQVVGTGVLGADALKASSAPVASIAGAIWGPAKALLLITASISMLGFMLGNVLGTSRLVYAQARDGFLPAFLATIEEKYRVPRNAVFAHALLALALALYGSFTQLVLISGGSICLMYLLVCAAAWFLQKRDVAELGKPTRLPLGPLIPLLAIVLLLWVLSTLKQAEWIAIGVALAAIMLIYGGIVASRKMAKA
jgi:basic amino acid/polyamine antiporter, APA family